MSASVNPDIVTDGLVLCLDAANSDCFRGEPTVNKINGLYSTTFANSGFTITNNYDINFDGSNTASLLTSGSWIARTSGYSSNFTQGNTYTTTWILKRVDRDTVSLGWGGAHTGTRVNVSVNLANGTVSSASDPSLYGIYSLGNGWYAVWYVTTLSGTAHYPQLSSTLAGAKYLYGGMQVEEKPYPTRIIDGTRGNNANSGGGLYDLINNINGTLTRASIPSETFYSTNNNGIWVFDGVTDKVGLISAPSRLEDSCTEVWFKTNGSQPSAYSMIFGYEQVGGGYSSYTTGPIAIKSNNKIFTSVITSTQGYRQLTSNLTLENNKFYHVCLNKDTINGTLTFYINGVFDSSTTFDADNLSSWPSAGNYIGRNYVDIGGYNLGTGSSYIGNGYLNGSVSIGKMYKKTLSSEEIAINYQALKGRYGL